MKTSRTWVFFLLAINGILILAVILVCWRRHGWTAFSRTIYPNQANSSNPSEAKTPELGRRYQLNYQQWVDILRKEANAAAQKQPEHLTILVGDSLSLWFPGELLPKKRSWLNQGISGETTAGLLKRLDLIDRSNPDAIFVMIGINDLIRGTSNEVILENQRQTIRYLRKMHPKAKIIIQSILPHGHAQATWEGREKLLALPNARIRQLNEQLQRIALQENVEYLNLHPLFANQQGELYPELSTDGLHLSPQGYRVWSSALQIYSQIALDQ